MRRYLAIHASVQCICHLYMAMYSERVSRTSQSGVAVALNNFFRLTIVNNRLPTKHQIKRLGIVTPLQSEFSCIIGSAQHFDLRYGKCQLPHKSTSIVHMPYLRIIMLLGQLLLSHWRGGAATGAVSCCQNQSRRLRFQLNKIITIIGEFQLQWRCDLKIANEN